MTDMDPSDSNRADEEQSPGQEISPEEAIDERKEEIENHLPSNLNESASHLLNRVFGAPECDECGRRFFHPSYKKLGNTIFETSVKLSFYVGLTYAIIPFIWKGMVIRKSVAKLCKRLGYDDFANELEKGSLGNITEHTLFDNLDDSWEEVQWQEQNKSIYCYEWPDCEEWPYDRD